MKTFYDYSFLLLFCHPFSCLSFTPHPSFVMQPKNIFLILYSQTVNPVLSSPLPQEPRPEKEEGKAKHSNPLSLMCVSHASLVSWEKRGAIWFWVVSFDADVVDVVVHMMLCLIPFAWLVQSPWRMGITWGLYSLTCCALVRFKISFTFLMLYCR